MIKSSNDTKLCLLSQDKQGVTYHFEKLIDKIKEKVVVLSLNLQFNKLYNYLLLNKIGYYVVDGVNKGRSGNMYSSISVSCKNGFCSNLVDFAFSSDVPCIEIEVITTKNNIFVYMVSSKFDVVSVSGTLQLVLS